MKHGLALEPHAKRELKQLFSHHKNVSLSDVGLHIMKSHPFIGASADGILSCNCCGTFVIEIKCPYSIKDMAPSSEHLDYLVSSEDENGKCITKLKENHKYYFQVQGQMGVTGVLESYFFVFTHHGHHLEKIKFNSELWGDLLHHLNLFWMTYVGPALLVQKNEKSKKEKNIHKQSLMSILTSDKTVANKTKKGSTKNQSSSKKTKQEGDLASKTVCGTCLKTVVDIPRNPSQNSISCSLCEIWYHMTCTDGKGIDSDTWACSFCSD